MKPVYSMVPKYIRGNQGMLYSLYYAPKTISNETEIFLVAPSFAEEMNRCRYMCTLLAQSLIENNCAFLSIDPYGTGDSEGEFVDAEWETSCSDLLTGVAYAEELGFKRISILGVRLGALQALKIAPQIKQLNRIILWQPVISGLSALTQFLRIKIAASIGRNETPGTISDFDMQIERGECLEVAGYDISPGLYKGIKNARLDDNIATCTVPIQWFSTLPSEGRTTPKAELNFIEKWKSKGVNLDHSVVYGPSYWQVHERALAPELIEATINFIRNKESS